MNNFLLNGKAYDFSLKNLPVLVHGQDAAGASFFSLMLVAKYIQAGQKVLFISKFPKALEEFEANLGQKFRPVKDESEIESRLNDSVIVVESGNGNIFQKIMRALKDTEDRIIFVKNAEYILTKGIWLSLKKLNHVIVSGNIDESSLVEPSVFKTRIYFSPAKKAAETFPPLKKHEAAFFGGSKRGTITTQQ